MEDEEYIDGMKTGEAMCKSKIEKLKTEIQTLRSRLEECEKEKTVGERLLSVIWTHMEKIDDGKVGFVAFTFRTMFGKAIQTYLNHQPGKYVAVRKDALKEIIRITDRKSELWDYLKAVLEPKEPKP